MKHRNQENKLTNQLSNKTEFFAVDYFRLLFSVGIVALHLRPLMDVNNVLDYFLSQVLSRLGVPFFFLVSGFFLQKKLDDSKKIKAYLVKLFRLYLVYTLLYMPQIVYGYINGEAGFLLNAVFFIKEFIFTGSYIHLWYFVGLMVATLLLYLFVRKLKLSDKHIMAIVLVLYVIGTVMNAYLQPFIYSITVPFSEMGTVGKQYLLLSLYFKFFYTTRNGLFFGFPYLFFGYLIAKNKESIYRKNYFLMAIVSFIVMTGEAFIAHKVFGAGGQDMLFMLLPTSIFVFLFILFIDCKNNQRNAHISKHTREISVLYYGLHLFINSYVSRILYKVILYQAFDIKLHSTIRFVILIILNYVAAEVIIRMSGIKYFKWLKNFY